MIIRILIVEDQRIVREGLRAVLEDEDEIAIVGEAANGQEAIDLFAQLQPDVVLMDLQMPVIDGPEATRRIRELSPDARILVLTTYATDEFIFKALRAGGMPGCTSASSVGCRKNSRCLSLEKRRSSLPSLCWQRPVPDDFV